jgi:hypothetical protein
MYNWCITLGSNPGRLPIQVKTSAHFQSNKLISKRTQDKLSSNFALFFYTVMLSGLFVNSLRSTGIGHSRIVVI